MIKLRKLLACLMTVCMAFSLMPFCQKIYRTSELTDDEIVKNVIAQRV